MVRTLRRSMFALTALAALLVAAPAGAASEARRTPDDKRTLISTDVGEERWAISWNDAEDGTVTGNVFFSDGRDPAFLWCEDITEDGVLTSRSFECLGAEACTASPCLISEWSFVQSVTVPVSFFEAPDLEWLSIGENVTLPLSFLSPPEEGSDAERDSGVQITIDDARVLVNKNVGGERWAITRNVEDKTLTGNIFTAGAEAQFIWCREVGYDAETDEATYACQVPGTEAPPPPPPAQFARASRLGTSSCDQFESDRFPKVVGKLFSDECWACPDGYVRTIWPLESSIACSEPGFGGAETRARYLGNEGCNTSLDSFERNDVCYTCPAGYEVVNPVPSADDACQISQ